MRNLYNTNWMTSGSVDIEVTTLCDHTTPPHMKRKQLMCDIASKIFGSEKKGKRRPFCIHIHMKLFWCVNLALTCILVHPVCESKICIKRFWHIVIPQHLNMSQLWMKSRFLYWIVTCATCGCNTGTSMWLKAWYVQAMLRGVKMLVRYCIIISSANKLISLYRSLP